MLKIVSVAPLDFLSLQSIPMYAVQNSNVHHFEQKQQKIKRNDLNWLLHDKKTKNKTQESAISNRYHSKN